MSAGFLVLLLIIAGFVLAFRLRGPALKRALKYYAVAAVLLVLGGVGALAWLGGETSGTANVFSETNPYVWSAIFVGGVLVLAVNSVLNIRDWRESRTAGNAKANPEVDEGTS